MAYLLALIFGIIGLFLSAKRFKVFSNKHQPLTVSVIIAVRNEMRHISQLLQHLHSQEYPSQALEIIIVDDHSDDGTYQWLEANKYPNVRLIKSPAHKQGKKAAIAHGIAHARHDILIFTDGDCTPEPKWVQMLIAPLHREHIKMVCGSVFINAEENKIFEQLQRVEFLSPLAVSAATLGWGVASMANGASYACRKSVVINFYAQQNEQNNAPASGDDMFLLHFVADRFPDGIAFASGKDCAVNTTPVKDLGAFFQQRLRWAGKWRHFKSGIVFRLALFTAVFNLNWYATLIWCFMGYWLVALALFMAKALLEWAFLSKFARQSHKSFSIMAFLILQLIYPVYALYIAAISLAKHTYYWKGRIWSTQ